MATVERIASFYEALVIQKVPSLENRIKVKVSPKARHLYEARRNGTGIKLTISFIPSRIDWETCLSRAITACTHIQAGTSDLVAVRDEVEAN